MVRLIDVNALISEETGVFERLPPGFKTLREAIESIERACLNNHGVVLPIFLSKVSENYDTMRVMLDVLQAEFCAANGVGNDGWENCLARPFALSFAAGILASEWKIYPWDRKLISEATSSCYRNARSQIPDCKATIADGMAKLRKFVREVDFLQWPKKQSGGKLVKSTCYRRISKDYGDHLLIPTNIFGAIFHTTHQRDLVLSELRASNDLIHTSCGNTVQVRPFKARFLVIRSSGFIM